MSELAEDEERNFQTTYNILEDLGLEGLSPSDCANVAYVCGAVSTRAAHLCAAGIAVLLNRMKKPICTVGIDGSVYRFHPRFKDIMNEKLPDLLLPGLQVSSSALSPDSPQQRPGFQFQLMLSEDGSGKGAALVAAVACRVEEERLAKSLSGLAT